jgi:predicted transcriptional regulator
MVRKLKDIRETASDAAEIVRALGNPEVRRSLEEVREITNSIQTIINSLSQPSMVKNIENIRMAAETLEATASKAENTVQKLKEAGILEEAQQTLRQTKDTLSLLGKSPQSTEMVSEVKEMITSIKDLVNELKLVVSQSKDSGIIRDVKDALEQGNKLYRKTKE